MNDKKYTPGPWTVDEDEEGNCFIRIPDHDLCFGDMETTDACCFANAYLIAAAPEMLDALDKAHKAMVALGNALNWDGVPQEYADAINAIRAAKAAAKGEDFP